VRIVGGEFRGRALVAPSGRDTRPTADRLRQTVFDILAYGSHGAVVPGARVLDLFAGTGALGLEALSRGAVQARFVENGAKALGLLRENIAWLGAGEATRVLAADATRLGPCPEPPFDLVFLDPPYRRGLGERALAAAGRGGWIAPGALLVWEEAAEVLPPPGLTLLDARRYGDTMITLMRVSA